MKRPDGTAGDPLPANEAPERSPLPHSRHWYHAASIGSMGRVTKVLRQICDRFAEQRVVVATRAEGVLLVPGRRPRAVPEQPGTDAADARVGGGGEPGAVRRLACSERQPIVAQAEFADDER